MSVPNAALRPLSCCTQCFGTFGAAATIEELAALGISELEVPIRTHGFQTRLGDPPLITTESTRDELEALLRTLEQRHLRAGSCQILSGSVIADGVLAITERKLEQARWLGVSYVVGDVGQPRDQAEIPRFYEALRRIGDLAGERGLIYGCETHPGLAQNLESMLALRDTVRHPHIKFNLDTGNLLYYTPGANLFDTIRQLGSDLGGLHLKDFAPSSSGWHFPPLGTGLIDFSKLLPCLHESLGIKESDILLDQRAQEMIRQVPVAIEVQGQAGEEPLTLEGYRLRTASSVAHLLACGWQAGLTESSRNSA